jgi:hypothetical protein
MPQKRFMANLKGLGATGVEPSYPPLLSAVNSALNFGVAKVEASTFQFSPLNI